MFSVKRLNRPWCQRKTSSQARGRRQLVMSLYDKRDDFSFSIHDNNYPLLDGNVPCMPSYRVYIIQLIRFVKACDTFTCTDFLTRQQNLVHTLTKEGFKQRLLCRKFKQFYSSNFDPLSRCSKSDTEHLHWGININRQVSTRPGSLQ